MTTTTAEKVRQAADYIERVGLHKDDPFDIDALYRAAPGAGGSIAAVEHNVPCCTLGALWGHRARVDMKFGRFLSERFGAPSVPSWNDAPERTKDEVVTALRQFADTLESEPT